MIQKLLLLAFFCSLLFADSLVVKENYFIDTTNQKNLAEVLLKKNDFKEMTQHNFGVFESTLWVHLAIKNTSDTQEIKKIYNKRAGLDFVDVYVLKDEKLVKTYLLGDMRSYDKRDNIFRVSFFYLSLHPDEQVDIFIKQKSYGSMETKWHISDSASFNRYFSIQSMIYFTIFGVLLVITVASFVFYIALRKKYYLIYGTFTLCSIIYQLAVAGFFYEFEIPVYLNTIFNYSVSLFTMVLLGMFPFYFFDIKKGEHKHLLAFLKILLVVIASVALLNLFHPLNVEFLYNIKYTNIASILVMLTLLSLSIKIYREKRQGAIFYLIGNFVLFISISYFIFGLVGLVANTYLYYYSLALGSIGQDLFLALALVQATYFIKEENEKNKLLLFQRSRFDTLGNILVGIVHQLKSPLNYLGTTLTYLEAKVNIEKGSQEDRQLFKRLNEVSSEVNVIIEDIYHLYSQENRKKTFEIRNALEYSLDLLSSPLQSNEVRTQIKSKEKILYAGYKSTLCHVLIIILENSTQIIRERKIPNAKITLDYFKKEDQIYITLEDNAGGIKPSDLQFIFDLYFSKRKNGTGIGLALAKELMSILEGTIEARNTQNGTLFTLVLS